MKGKQGVEIATSTMIMIVIALIAALIILLVFYNHSKDSAKVGDTFISDTEQDCDQDGVKNIIDRCPCNKVNDASQCNPSDKSCCPQKPK